MINAVGPGSVIMRRDSSQLELVRGQWVTVAARVWIPDGADAAPRVSLSTGGDGAYSLTSTALILVQWHGAWAWVVQSFYVPANATRLTLQLFARSGSTGTPSVVWDRIVSARGTLPSGALPAKGARGPQGESSPPGGLFYVEKATDEVRNNTAIVTDDSELRLTLAAGATYVGECVFEYDSTTANPDIKCGLSAPVDAVGRVFADGLMVTSTTGLGSLSRYTTSFGAGAGTNNVFGAVSGSSVWARLKFRVVMATAGDLSFHWSQNTATVEDTTIRAGSFMTAQRVV